MDRRRLVLWTDLLDWGDGRNQEAGLFAVGNSYGLRSGRAKALCGLFLCGFLCGSLMAVLVGLGRGYGWFPGTQSPATGSNVDPTALADMDWELRRGSLPGTCQRQWDTLGD